MKTIKFLSLIGITFFLLNACEKGSPSDQIVTNNLSLKNNPVLNYSLDNIPYIPNNQDITKLLLNPENLDDEKINTYLYELSLATRDLVKNADFNKKIIEMAKASPNQTANLLELEE